MQHKDKIKYFNTVVGKFLKKIRQEKGYKSLNQFALAYDFDRGNFSRVERGLLSCKLSTVWKFAQANNMKFSELAKLLEEEFDKKFTLIDV